MQYRNLFERRQQKMKKLMVIMLAVGMMYSINAAPALAWERHHDRGGRVFWPVVGGVVVGSLIYDIIRPQPYCAAPPPPPVYHQTNYYSYYSPPPPPPPPHEVCYEVVEGEWRVDAYGYRYWYRYDYPMRRRVPCR